MFKDKSWNEKTELERFQTIVDEIHEIIWGTPRRPEIKFEGMMTTKKPIRARGLKGRYKGDIKETKEYNEAWVGGKSPKKRTKKNGKK